MKYVYLVTLFFLMLSHVEGQNKTKLEAQSKIPKQDLVVLKTGKRIWGEIQFYELGKAMVFRTDEGVLMKIPFEILDKFVAGAHTTNLEYFLKPEKPEKPFLQAETFYNNFALFMPFGVKTTANSRSGLGFEYSFGMQMTPKLGVGLGTGMNFMFGGISDRLIPIVAEIRYYNNPDRRHRAYALLDSGYSVGWSADKQTEAYSFKGGWRIHPALGVVWHNAKTTRFTTELGYWHQRATLVEDWWESSRWRRENDYKLNRWVLKMGLLF